MLEVELFDHSTVYLQNILTNHIFNIYVKNMIWHYIPNYDWYAIKKTQKRLICHFTKKPNQTLIDAKVTVNEKNEKMPHCFMNIYIYIYIYKEIYNHIVINTPKKRCLRYDTKLYLTMRLQFSNAGECIVHLHCNIHKFTWTQSGSTC